MLSNENGHQSMGRALTRTRAEDWANARLGFDRLRAEILQYEIRSTENKESYDKIYKGKKEDRHHWVAFIPFFDPAQFKWYNTMCKKTNFVATLASEMDIQNATNNVRSTKYRRTTWLSSLHSPLSSTAEALEINGCSFATRPQRLRRITSIPAFSVYRMHVGRSLLSSLPAVCWTGRRYFVLTDGGETKWQVSRTDILWLALLPTTVFLVNTTVYHCR